MDMTRELFYGAIEMFLDSKGKPGRQCLLKSICDAAEHSIVQGGIFEEIVHLILTLVIQLYQMHPIIFYI